MKYIFKTITAAAFLGTVAFPALSQSTSNSQATTPPPPPPPYCENNPGFDDWDFWVGEWNVYSNNEARNYAGHNVITEHFANCMLRESWTGSGGGQGGSVNYYNPLKGENGEWRQIWVANGYMIDFAGGLNEEGSMVLNGFIYGYRPKAITPFRGTWSKFENGDVRQFFEIHDAEGNWTTWFDGRYVRKETDPNPPEAQ